MSLDRFVTGSPLSANFPSPSESDQWLAQEFADDLFSGTSDLDHALSAEEDKLFGLDTSGSFPDALSDLGNLPDQPNDRQVVMAAATAAGLNRNGIRRTAFSTGDLQALSGVPNRQTPSPPDPQRLDIHRTISSSSVSAQPGLATVPEGRAMNASLSAGLPTMHYTAEPLVPTEDLSNMSVEELQAELIRTRQAFHSAGMPMYGSRQSGQPFVPQQSSFSSIARPMYSSGTRGGLADFGNSGMLGGSSGFGGFYQDESGNMRPLSSHAAPTSSAMDQQEQAEQQQQTQMLQSYADALLYQNDATTSEGSAGLPPSSNAPQVVDMQQQEATPPTLAAQPASQHPAAPSTSGAEQAEAINRDKFIRRSQSAVELRSLGLPRHASEMNLKELQQVTVELTTPEGHVYKAGRMSNEERAQKILKYRQKRHERNFTKRIKYMCRKTLADTRPRVRGRFARNNDAGAVMPHETKKALAAKAKAGKAAAAASVQSLQPSGAAPADNLLYARLPSSQSQGMTGYAPSMLSRGQGPAKSTHQPFPGPSSAAPHAFMPMMQQSTAMQPGMNHTPLLQNGTVYPMHQGLQYSTSMPLAQQSLHNRQITAQSPVPGGQPSNIQTPNAGSSGLLDQSRATSAYPM